jgi:restriction endonuclease Mrr
MNIQEQMADEQKIFKQNELIMATKKTEKLNRFKIDLLLRVNSTISSQMGIDSSDKEVAFCKKLRKENLKKIKEIDPEFFETINDNEG